MNQQRIILATGATRFRLCKLGAPRYQGTLPTMQLLSLYRGHLAHRIQASLVLTLIFISGCLVSASFVKQSQPWQPFYLGETKYTQASSDKPFTKDDRTLEVEYGGHASKISFDGSYLSVTTGLLSFSRFRDGFKGPTVTPMDTNP